jgi:hypothetical protein
VIDKFPSQLQALFGSRRAEAPVEPFCECGCPFEAHISINHVLIPCITCGPCREWRPVAA